jgi:hypothetical protein
MIFRLLAILLTLAVFSCNTITTKEKTFLDYEFGMSYDEYHKHTMTLYYENKIKFVSGLGTSAMGLVYTPNIDAGNSSNLIEYKLSLPNERGGTYNFIGEVRGDVSRNNPSSLLTSIGYRFEWGIGDQLNLFGYKQVQKALSLKYGNTYVEDSVIDKEGKMYRSTWENKNTGFSFVVDERPEFRRAEFFYYAKGSLEENINRKAKSSEKPEHDLKNKY